MATYVNNLRLKEIATGDESGTWGTSTNTNLELITDALGYGTKQVAADSNETFTMPDATADGTRALYLKFTSAGSLTATRTLTLAPNTVSKMWMIENATSGSQSITIKQGSGAEVTIATGEKAWVYTDGAGAGAAVALANPTETGTGTVTSVATTGTVNGITLTGGTITTTGTLTLGGTLSGVDLTSQVTGILPTANGGTGSSATTFVDLTTNVTGTLPVANGGTGITSLGTGIATWWGTPSSANLASAVTDETGTGALVFATAPSLVGKVDINGTLSIDEVIEAVEISATTSGTIGFGVLNGAVDYYNVDQTANRTINFMGDGGTTLDATLAVGESVTVAVLMQQGATPYYLNVYQVDGVGQTPLWQGGTAPTAGNASSTDIYTFTIVKTASATYKIFAVQSVFS